MKKIAIIGAGIAGLTLAHRLSKIAEVVIFEKSRGVSGRMSTRYYGDFEFDHGAQFFTIKTPEFSNFIRPLIDSDVVAKWDVKLVELDRNKILREIKGSDLFPHYVGSPRMNQVGKFLAKEMDVSLQTHVQSISKTKDSNWNLIDKNNRNLGQFDWVISTAPAEQTQDIFPSDFSGYTYIQNRKMLGCFSLMLGFNKPLSLKWDAAIVNNSDISWIAVNSSKPGRPESFSLIVQTSNSWANVHIEEDPDKIKKHIMAELSDVTGIEINGPACCELHRWRYANISSQKGNKYLLDEKNQLAACGDWCIEGRVESAFISANTLSAALIDFL